MVKIFPWLPRILAIGFIIFISLFALDVANDPQWLLALIIHLIPSDIAIIYTVIAWSRPRLGAILFIITSLLLFVFSRTLILSFFTLTIGLLFLLSSFLYKPQPGPQATL